MDVRKIVAVVEDAEVARTALNWALHNLVRHGDLITLLHVFPYSRSRSRNKLRIRRLKGFQLALSFKDICTNFPNAKIEIVVREGDEDGGTIAAIVREIRASTLVVGLHNRSFLYRLPTAHNNIASNFNCKVVAIKQQTPPPFTPRNINISSPNILDFSRIEIAAGLSFLDILPPKKPYRLCPDPSAIIWRSRKRRNS
ncbi:hypothetical protein RHGRI_026012 [Rhododendron griersonianum]|uniref:UspA domain-containing protein n=1 Tax=Rhododendron griersonianum TaxID=479676 RepID=A0AAV6IVP9_9ERIC|nr:hypothetical protein RHGRI_026012 [Rhododendron griersonianum]